MRLAILGSHPIPYRTPLYRLLARRDDVEVLVLYGDDYGVRPRSSEWGVENFVWKTDITEGYPHVFLSNWAPKPDPSSVTGRLNPTLIPTLRKFRPHAVLAMGYHGVYQLHGLAGAALWRTPVIFLAETNVLASNPAGVRGWLKPKVLGALYKRLAAFLTIGTRNREHYRRYEVPERKLFRFPYAVDNDFFSREAVRLRSRRNDLRARWGISENSVCVVYAGRLSPEKNVAELICGVAKVPQLHLLISGSGPEQPELEKLAGELIPGRHTFAGFLNQDELGDAYTAADMLALTSLRETWGLTCNEAMNFGLPLVLSDRVGAAADLIIEGVTGRSYQLGDVDALARALRDVSEIVPARRDQTAEVVRGVIAEFSFERQVEGVSRALHFAASDPSRVH